MAVGSQRVDAGLPHVERKGAQALNGVHHEEAAVAMADLPDRFQVGAAAAEVLNEADGEQAGAAGGLVDSVQTDR